MKKTLMCATAAAALAATGFVAQAEDGWYGRADVGYVFDGLMDHDAENNVLYTLGDNSDPNDAVLYGLGLGYGFDNGFRLETAISNREGDLDVPSAINGGLPAAGGGVDFALNPEGDVRSWDLMVNALYDFNREGNFNPYIGAGIGVAQISADARNIAAGDFGVGSTFAGANGFLDQETGLAYQALAGLGIGVTDQLTVDIGYRLFNVGDLDMTGVTPSGGATSYEV
ncbi:MAG: porin family protein, partial [Henriciella sp.]|nr:porin family protein [Henriciella sp.]